MGRGKTSNPTDQYRKQQKKYAINKNKEKIKTQREQLVEERDPETYNRRIREIDEAEKIGTITANMRIERKNLKAKLNYVLSKNYVLPKKKVEEKKSKQNDKNILNVNKNRDELLNTIDPSLNNNSVIYDPLTGIPYMTGNLPTQTLLPNPGSLSLAKGTSIPVQSSNVLNSVIINNQTLLNPLMNLNSTVSTNTNTNTGIIKPKSNIIIASSPLTKATFIPNKKSLATKSAVSTTSTTSSSTTTTNNNINDSHVNTPFVDANKTNSQSETTKPVVNKSISSVPAVSTPSVFTTSIKSIEKSKVGSSSKPISALSSYFGNYSDSDSDNEDEDDKVDTTTSNNNNNNNNTTNTNTTSTTSTTSISSTTNTNTNTNPSFSSFSSTVTPSIQYSTFSYAPGPKLRKLGPIIDFDKDMDNDNEIENNEKQIDNHQNIPMSNENASKTINEMNKQEEEDPLASFLNEIDLLG